MFKCNVCGYECEELPTVNDYIEKSPVCIAVPNANDICSCCGGTMEWAKKCPVCEEWYCESDYDGTICEGCFSKLSTFNNGYKYFREVGDTAEIDINLYLKSVVDNLGINIDELVYKYVKAHYTNMQLNNIMRKATITMLVFEGSDAEEFLLKEAGI